MIPDFYIIGAPKSGTTTVAHWLQQTPSVFMSEPKEPHYFAQEFKRPMARGAYEEIFAGVTADHRAVGEASTNYLQSETAFSDILREAPEARFIVCLRNPVDMAYSLHGHLLFAGKETESDFRTAWELQETRRAGRSLPFLVETRKKLLYAEVCALGSQLERLYERVAPEKVYCAFLEDISSEPARVYREVVAFLGAAPADVSFEVRNAARVRKSRRLFLAVAALHRLRRKLGIPNLRSGILKFVTERNVADRARPPMPADMRAELVAFFEPEIAKLERLTGRDLAHWR